MLACRYCAPETHALLARCKASSLHVRFESTLTLSGFTCLWDHAVLGRAIMPGAAMLEAAASAHKIMLSVGSPNKITYMSRAHVSSASILMPLALSPPSPSMRVAFIVEVDTILGDLSQLSQTGGTQSSLQRHFVSSISQYFHQSEARAVQSRACAAIQTILQQFLCIKNGTWPRIALASLYQESLQQARQYVVHPALLDNCTQASSALIDMPAPSTSTSTNTRIPVGVHACRIIKQLRHVQAWASASITGLLPDESALGDYSLVSSEHAFGSASICGMVFKPVGHSNIMTSQPKATIQSVDFLPRRIYKVVWTVLQPHIIGVKADLSRSYILEWQSLNAHASVQERFKMISSQVAASSAASSLHFLQMQRMPQMRLITKTHVHSLADQGFKLMTFHNDSMHSAAAAGLLRVASREVPTTHWQHIMQDRHGVNTSVTDQEISELGALGISASNGALYTPLIRASNLASHGCITRNTPNPVNGQSTIITGGLGSIGSLVGMWRIAHSNDAPIIMLSRSGRRKSLQVESMALLGYVCFARCDVAQSEDVAALASTISCSQQQMQAVMHAGGVIEDGLIRNQVHKVAIASVFPDNIGCILQIYTCLCVDCAKEML